MSGEVVAGRSLDGPATLETDVLVIGSGAGGAVVASRLAEAGREVVLAEEGPHVAPEVYGAMRPSQSIRTLWRDSAMSFALGMGGSPVINVTMGRCVGGSSVLTGGVWFRTPDDVLHEWAQDMGLGDLGPERMAQWFDQVERDVHIETVAEAMRSESTVLFDRGLRARGLALEPLRRNTRGCRGCGTCNFGCPHQAKLSVDHTYLPRALRAGARILSDCRVDRLTVEGGRATGALARLLDERGRPRRRITLRARTVVVAAGAWHSPLLFLRSGLGGRSGQVGRNLTLHPGFRMVARFDSPVRGWSGALQSAFSSAFMAEGLTLVSLFVPPGVLAATVPGVGPEHAARAEQASHLAMFGGMIHDHGGGRVRRGPGREPFVTYRMAPRDRALIPRIIRLMAQIYFDAGARECYVPVLGLPPVRPDALQSLDLEHVPGSRIECSSQHPLGSLRMGTSPSRSVVDPDGRVWDVDGLWVADGSVVPTSLGVNPQGTVMAMALRIAHRIMESPPRRPQV